MSLKLHIWMNFPSHHQSGLFHSLVRQGVDLQVTYYDSIPQHRLALGWTGAHSAATWEAALAQLGVSHTERLRSLRDYVHIIPGYGSRLLRDLAVEASRMRLKWCHWSEASRAGWRWWLRYPWKRRHATLLNANALGALAQGHLARMDFIRWGIRPDKIADLTYAVPEPNVTVAPDERITAFSGGRGVFLFLGRMDYGKAIDIQLRAFRSLRTDSWSLVLAGPGDVKKYTRLAQRLGIGRRVLFLPPVSSSEVAALHQASDVLLLPSRYDGWGVVVNEAALLSKALIVSTACGSAWHLVEPGVNGVLVAPGSVNSLQGAMRSYVDGGRRLAARHGRESRRICLHYTCDATARRLIDVLHTWQAA